MLPFNVLRAGIVAMQATDEPAEVRMRIHRVLLAAVLVLLPGCGREPVAPEPSFARQPPPPPQGPAPVDLSNGGAVLGEALTIDPLGFIVGNNSVMPRSLLTWDLSRDWAPGPCGTVVAGSGNRLGDATGSHQTLCGARGAAVYLATDNGDGTRSYTSVLLAGGEMARDINDARVIAGYNLTYVTAWASPTDATPAYWTASPYGSYTNGRGINNSNVVVGDVAEAGGRWHAWRWQVRVLGPDEVTIDDLGELPWAPGAEAQSAYRINDAGVVVGFAQVAGSKYPARWVPDGTGGHTVSVLSSHVLYGAAAFDTWGLGFGLNRCGSAVFVLNTGTSRQQTPFGFVWDATGASVLLPGLPGSSGSLAWDIADNGDVVGASLFTPKRGSTTLRPTLWPAAVPPCP